MRPLTRFPTATRARVRTVLFDIDDTLTTEGRLSAAAYGALERLHEAGLTVIPITGRPAGWCDHIARMWPVDAVVGENGAFYFRYLRAERRLIRRFVVPEAERAGHRRALENLRARILAAVPGAGVASDQPYREADLAIDYCEDVAPLPPAAVARIVALFEDAGATAKVSSIHVNGWFGTYDKLTTTRLLFAEAFAADLDAVREECVFVGDSPNDAPMFAYFPHAVGVANVRDFAGALPASPAYVTRRRAGAGFAELARALLRARRPPS
ncbi:MAG: HAD-IIB family hydrolase [Alphaproteobacteria bacterium]|nr:MAG: HAD-IIB family hydrolase [Alphaproteobacteria bacterium]